MLGSTQPHLRRDWARPCHICTGTGLTPATSAPGLGTCPPTSAPELGTPRPHLRWDSAKSATLHCNVRSMPCRMVSRPPAQTCVTAGRTDRASIGASGCASTYERIRRVRAHPPAPRRLDEGRLRAVFPDLRRFRFIPSRIVGRARAQSLVGMRRRHAPSACAGRHAPVGMRRSACAGRHAPVGGERRW